MDELWAEIDCSENRSVCLEEFIGVWIRADKSLWKKLLKMKAFIKDYTE